MCCCSLIHLFEPNSFNASIPQTMNCHYIGYPAAVGNLTVHSHQSSILLTWTPPFSLDITGVNPDFWYCVEVYNITWGRAPLTTNCSVYEPQFYFTAPNHSRCDLFEFRVFAVNQVGNGSVVSVNGTYITSNYQTSKTYHFSAACSALHVMAIILISSISPRTIF